MDNEERAERLMKKYGFDLKKSREKKSEAFCKRK